MKSTFGIRLASILIFLGLWEVVGRSGLVLPQVLPPASEVLVELFGLFNSSYLAEDAAASLYEILLGLFFGSIFGLAVGICMGASSYLYSVLEPLIYYFGAIPKIVVFPLFILFLGTGLESKIGMATISAFFPIVFNTALAIREVKPIHVRAARTLGASWLQLYGKVYVPSTLGPMLFGIRLGLGIAVTGALLAETAVADVGLGFRAIELYSQLRIAEMYALILLIFIGASLLNLGFGKLIQMTTHYEQQEVRGESGSV